MSFLATFPLVLSAQKGVSPCPVILLLSLNSPWYPSHSITVTTDLLSSKMSTLPRFAQDNLLISGHRKDKWLRVCLGPPVNTQLQECSRKCQHEVQILGDLLPLSAIECQIKIWIPHQCLVYSHHLPFSWCICQGDLRMLGEPNKASVSIAWHIGIFLSTIFSPYLIL